MADALDDTTAARHARDGPRIEEGDVATDLMVMLEDRPGTLAELATALGNAGTNLGGACAVTAGGQGELHLLVEDDVETARRALADAGYEVALERDVMVVDVGDRPGALASHAQRLARARVNIELMYVATGTRVVFGVDELDTARDALG